MNVLRITMLCLFVYASAEANIGPQGFKKYRNHYFVETGTFWGDGVARALKEGFKQVRSIEADQSLYDAAKARFAAYPNVMIVKGDSAYGLWDIIKDIDQEITFWLDAHIYPAIKGKKNCPLIEELEQIGQHPIKTHIILIDDMHCVQTEAFDWLSKEDLIAKIKEINPAYMITYIPGGNEGEYPHNVMVAYVPKEYVRA